MRGCRIGAGATLHDRVGQTIEAQAGISLDEEVGTLALHYFEAQRWDKAWVFCRRAATEPWHLRQRRGRPRL